MTEREDGEALREVMRHVPSPVTVVTAAHDGEMRGITIGSFTSTSLEPPLISFNVGRDSQMYPLIRTASRFAVHILSSEQAYLGNNFASPDVESEDQFANVEYHLDEQGVPVLSNVVAVLLCRPHAVHEAGDHDIFVGEVLSILAGGAERPLVYYDRSYRLIGSMADTTLFEPIGGNDRES